MPSGEKYVSVLNCHSGDILNYYANDKRISSFVAPAEQSNQALKPLFEAFNNSGSIKEVSLKPIRTGPSYPKVSCCKYPACHELTVKIFVQCVADELIGSCIAQILSELGFNVIDHLVVSFDENESVENIDAIWRQVYEQKKLKRANTIGVADFCKHKLERLIDSTGIKPDVDQLAPTASNGYCGISPGLMSYAKEEDIKLKTHGDPCCRPSAMSADINTIVQSADSRWKTMFVARYSQMSKDRLCITKKGFTAQFRLY